MHYHFLPYFQYSQRNKNRLKIRESQQGKCIKIKRPAHLSIVERLGGFWRVQRYEDYSKPANFWGEILISHAKKYKAFTN